MSVKKRWTGALLVTPRGVVARDILVDDGRISALVLPGTSTEADRAEIDCQGKIIFPGMIDVLQHGFDQNQYHFNKPGAVEDSAAKLPARGVTAFLPSIGCMPPADFEGVLRDLTNGCRAAKGARALGVHSEGPCFNSPGAHNPANMQLPSERLAEAMLEATEGTLGAVTLAPELPGAEAFIRRLKAAGVSIHFGHSQAAPEDVSRYVSWGIDAVTHMYDVMRALPPDNSGVHVFSLPDALLSEPDLALGVVVDGIHAHPKLVRILSELPKERVFLETDSMMGAGLPAAEFEFFPGRTVISAPGKAVRSREGGLCGSSLTSDEALRNYIQMVGADLVQAAYAASLVPARVLGREKDMGSIERGKLADFVVMTPGSFQIEETVVGGVTCYRRAQD